jgi:nucleoid-associated protein YgaU
MKARFVQYLEDRQSTLASGLAALLIIVAGFLVFSYFSGLNKQKAPAVTSTSTQSAQLIQATAPVKSAVQNSTSTPVPASSKPAPTPSSSQKTVVADTKQATYTVAQGDSLTIISQKYYQDSNKWTMIADANKLANPSVIHVGNVLTIPNVVPQLTVAAAPSPVPAETPKTSAAVASANAVKTTSSYTVQAGDTLWSIAEKYYGTGFEWYRINQANGDLPLNTNGKPIITPGQNLKIP